MNQTQTIYQELREPMRQALSEMPSKSANPEDFVRVEHKPWCDSRIVEIDANGSPYHPFGCTCGARYFATGQYAAGAALRIRACVLMAHNRWMSFLHRAFRQSESRTTRRLCILGILLTSLCPPERDFLRDLCRSRMEWRARNSRNSRTQLSGASQSPAEGDEKCQ